MTLHHLSKLNCKTVEGCIHSTMSQFSQQLFGVKNQLTELMVLVQQALQIASDSIVVGESAKDVALKALQGQAVMNISIWESRGMAVMALNTSAEALSHVSEDRRLSALALNMAKGAIAMMNSTMNTIEEFNQTASRYEVLEGQLQLQDSRLASLEAGCYRDTVMNWVMVGVSIAALSAAFITCGFLYRAKQEHRREKEEFTQLKAQLVSGRDSGLLRCDEHGIFRRTYY